MARRPYTEHISLHVQVPRGIEGYWSIIQYIAESGDGTFTIRAIDALSNVDIDSIRDYVKRLEKAGYVAKVATSSVSTTTGIRETAIYRLIRNAYTAPRIRRDGTVLPEASQDTLWRTMKMLKRFTAASLHLHARGAGCAPPPLQTIKRYLNHLAQGGILRRLTPGGGRGHASEYQLVLNVGARAPKILRTHIVFDPNSNEILGAAEVKEVA